MSCAFLNGQTPEAENLRSAGCVSPFRFPVLSEGMTVRYGTLCVICAAAMACAPVIAADEKLPDKGEQIKGSVWSLGVQTDEGLFGGQISVTQHDKDKVSGECYDDTNTVAGTWNQSSDTRVRKMPPSLPFGRRFTGSGTT